MPQASVMRDEISRHIGLRVLEDADIFEIARALLELIDTPAKLSHDLTERGRSAFAERFDALIDIRARCELRQPSGETELAPCRRYVATAATRRRLRR